MSLLFTGCLTTDAILEDPVVGFQNLEYSISEGETLTACVLVLSGGSIFPFSVQMVSVSGTAEGEQFSLHSYR